MRTDVKLLVFLIVMNELLTHWNTRFSNANDCNDNAGADGDEGMAHGVFVRQLDQRIEVYSVAVGVRWIPRLRAGGRRGFGHVSFVGSCSLEYFRCRILLS